MASNPMLNNGRIDAQNNGLQNEPASVNPKDSWKQNLHKFNNSYKHATTERYADISPFMVMDVVEGDNIPFEVIDKVRTYTMQAPLEDEIFKRKFYTLVPMRAIMPNTWKLIYANPTHGDDVPEDAYCNLDIVRQFRQLYMYAFKGELNVTRLAELLISAELLFSVGALPAKLKCNLWPYMYNSPEDNLDVVLDIIYPQLFDIMYLDVEVAPGEYVSVCASQVVADAKHATLIDPHTFLDYLRSDNGSIKYIDNSVPILEDIYTQVVERFDKFPLFATNPPTRSIDFSRFIAYQISCVSQVSDPSIDYIFNANLFRNVLFNTDGSRYVFDYNGQYVCYDAFSNVNLVDYFSDGDIAKFFRNTRYLFSYQKSLKYSDYFITARPEPLAVGDITLSSDSSGDYSALDVARKLVYTRFLNWNNRVGPKYEDYVKSLTGVDALPDPTEPSFINTSVMVVKGYDVENTGSDQFNLSTVTSIVNSADTSREFDIFISEPSILLGMSSYDVQRLYTRGIDRSFFKSDRFDFFNNRLQYTGDQEIFASELDVTQQDVPVAYTTKDMHYKQQVSHANGGFIFALPSWAMTSENDKQLGFVFSGINSDFIRNSNGPFDQYFGSLTGYSLGTYFHFICRYHNILPTMRPMDVAPDILK